MEGKLNVDDNLQDHQYQSMDTATVATDMGINANAPNPVTLIEMMTKSNNAEVADIINTTSKDTDSKAKTAQSNSYEYANEYSQSHLIADIDTIDTSSDAILAVYSTNRFFAAVSIMTSSGALYFTNPGTHYMIAGILLFASYLAEFLAKATDSITFVATMVGSLILVITGAMSIDRRDVESTSVGMLWSTAALFMAFAHTFDFVKSYGKVNIILSFSKITAIIGATIFVFAGLTMHAMENIDENASKFASLFETGGIMYLVHSITIAAGHKAVLDRVFLYQLRQQQRQQHVANSGAVLV